jgi:proline iminopeptidase
MRGFGRSQGHSLLPDKSVAVADSETLQQQSAAVAQLAYELEDYAQDLAALLDQLQVEHIYLNAHSMGASVGTLFLNLYSERVEKAILTCSGIFEYEEKSFAAFHKFGGYAVRFRPRWLAKIPFVDQIFMARFLHQPIPAAERRAFLEDFLLADHEAALNTIFTSVSKAAAELMPQEFSKLRVPTLLVSGEYDKIIPAAMGEQAAALNNSIEYALIPATAHFPMLEAPTVYLQRCREFLVAN